MTFQAYALLSEYMGNLSDMESIKYILYDDNCYLGKFAENEERAAKNKVSEKLGKRTGMYIDRFHFKNHIGKECVQKRDPYKIKPLNDVNTQAAEQLFWDVNKHSNCQAMSEPHFFLFWLYIFDLHILR